MSSRRAIIVGHLGQDGRLLTRLLQDRGYGLVGVGRSRTDAFGSVSFTGEVRLDQPATIARAVRELVPDEIYYLAAHHASSEAQPALELREELLTGQAVNFEGVVHFLEAVRLHAPAARLFFASSSLVFGTSPERQPQDESTVFAADEPYGWQKALASHACRQYRRRYGTYASVGILYNHESAFRPPQFLSMKIVRAAVLASRGSTDGLVLGDLDVSVDWGYSPDYVEAFTRILALEEPSDFVIATGEPHTVRELATVAFSHVGLDWQRYVTVDSSLLSRRAATRVGDSSKLRRATGWRPSLSFEQMVRLLVDQVSSPGE
ncbi:MAG: GDP-mannose 4,6-dehydratase, partial [Myxococcaceae bacterium]